jgi:hypothetical protein
MYIIVFIICFASITLGISEFVVLEEQVVSECVNKKPLSFFIIHPRITEYALHILLSGGILVLTSSIYIRMYSRDLYAALLFLVLGMIFVPTFLYTIHRKLNHFIDVIAGESEISARAGIEELEPVLMARITLVAWFGSIISVIISFVIYDVDQFHIIAQVLMWFGTGGIVFLTCPLLFSISALRKHRTQEKKT